MDGRWKWIPLATVPERGADHWPNPGVPALPRACAGVRRRVAPPAAVALLPASLAPAAPRGTRRASARSSSPSPPRPRGVGQSHHCVGRRRPPDRARHRRVGTRRRRRPGEGAREERDDLHSTTTGSCRCGTQCCRPTTAATKRRPSRRQTRGAASTRRSRAVEDGRGHDEGEVAQRGVEQTPAGAAAVRAAAAGARRADPFLPRRCGSSTRTSGARREEPADAVGEGASAARRGGEDRPDGEEERQEEEGPRADGVAEHGDGEHPKGDVADKVGEDTEEQRAR